MCYCKLATSYFLTPFIMFYYLLTAFTTVVAFVYWWGYAAKGGITEGMSTVYSYFRMMLRLCWTSKMWKKTRRKLFHITMFTHYTIYLLREKIINPMYYYMLAPWILIMIRPVLSLIPLTRGVLTLSIIWIYLLIMAIETFLRKNRDKTTI